MDIKRLKQFITLSNEDFADSHEPVNDGVKDVPDANDIANMVGRSGGEADLTTQGEGKVIPEQEDKEEDKGTEHTESNVDEGTGPGGQDNEQPEEQTESPIEDEPELAHDDVKAVDVDEKVTAKEKESLEAFVPKIKRAELIGYSTRDVKALTNSIGRIRAKAGVRGAFTVSAESINETIVLAETHLGKLGRKRKFLKQRELTVAKENFLPVEEAVITEAPLAHPGSAPLPAAVGVAITEAELQPFAEGSPEQQGIIDTLGQIQQLENAAVAVEEFRCLLNDNKGRISKQAAAIIHTSLEHIDATCGLRVRATGLENYTTSPKHSMESVDVDEKTMTSRAGMIGAKIMQLIRELLERAKVQWLKYKTGITTLHHKCLEMKEKVDALKGEPTVHRLEFESGIGPYAYADGKFIGSAVSKNETDAVTAVHKTVISMYRDLALPVIAIINNGKADDETLDKLKDIFDNTDTETVLGKVVLPSNAILEYGNGGFHITKEAEGNFSGEVPRVDMSNPAELKMNFNKIVKFVDNLAHEDDIDKFIEINEKLSKALVQLRTRSQRGMFDESIYQKIQQTSSFLSTNFFSLNKYFEVMDNLAKAQVAKIRVYNHIVMSWNSGYKENV